MTTLLRFGVDKMRTITNRIGTVLRNANVRRNGASRGNDGAIQVLSNVLQQRAAIV